MKNATIKAKTTFCSSPPQFGLSQVGDVASAVENAWAAYSGTIAAPHEYFDQTGIQLLDVRDEFELFARLLNYAPSKSDAPCKPFPTGAGLGLRRARVGPQRLVEQGSRAIAAFRAGEKADVQQYSERPV